MVGWLDGSLEYCLEVGMWVCVVDWVQLKRGGQTKDADDASQIEPVQRIASAKSKGRRFHRKGKGCPGALQIRMNVKKNTAHVGS
jgi:hypothetical protein